jgi:hypothetical protein
MLEDYPANPMDSIQNQSPDYEDSLFDWQGKASERERGKASNSRSNLLKSAKSKEQRKSIR